MPRPRRERRRAPRGKESAWVSITRFGNTPAYPKVDHEVGLDVGLGGMMIVCTNKFGVGTPMEMSILLPDEGTVKAVRAIHAKGQVRWIRRKMLHGEKQYVFGVKFTNVAREAREAITEFLRRVAESQPQK